MSEMNNGGPDKKEVKRAQKAQKKAAKQAAKQAAKSPMKLCGTCGREIARKAKVCPYCGAKNKKPVYKRAWFIVLTAAVAVFIIAAVVSGMDSDAVKEAKKMDKTEFINSCRTYEYKELQRDADSLTGKHIKVTVYIEQNVDDMMFRAYTKGEYDEYLDDLGWSGNEFILNDVRDSQDPKLVEGDIVTVYGVYAGEEEVDRAIGGSDDVPSIDVIYMEFKKK